MHCARAACSRKDTVLSFDELYGKNLPALAEHEWRALYEASASCGFSFQFITWMLFNGPATRYARAAVQITDVGPHCRHAHGHTEASAFHFHFHFLYGPSRPVAIPHVS